ncbi:MAG: MarR family winged helix-turn-helix transcriptional regulator [Sphaerochaetaceae bacterium]
MPSPLDLQNLGMSINTLPRFLHTVLSSFRPNFNIPIKKNEIKAIMEIYHTPNKTMNFYIHAVDMESGSFTYLTDKLVQKNIIIKKASLEDKRKTTLNLSPFGKEIAQQLMEQLNAHFYSLLKDLEDEDLQDLKNALRVLDAIYSKIT